jgi:nucleoside phosphorylase
VSGTCGIRSVDDLGEGFVVDQALIAVVLTPIRVEFHAVREHLLDFQELDRVKGTIFYGGRLSRGPWQVVLARPGPGNITAAALAERAISHFRPELVMLVGIAGKLHSDLSLGDIVVGKKVYAIHSGIEENAGFRPRPETWKPADELYNEAERIDASGTWRNALPDQSRSVETKVEFRAIASAEVVLDSKDSELMQRLRHLYEDAAVIEMEGAGVGEACRLNKVAMINIRAVSDYADGSKRETDQAGGQEPAARNAAAFAMALLADVPPTRRATAERRPSRHVLVSGSIPAPSRAGSSGWAAGEQVVVGDREYLLVEGTFAARPLAGGAARQRETRGLQVSPTPRPGTEHVWLRQVDVRSNETSARVELIALAAERDLLMSLGSARGFPGLVQFDEQSSTLVTSWPVSRSTRLPCETLDLIAAPGPRLDEWRTVKLFKGLAGLCQTLAVLHDHGRAHRCLVPAGLIRLDNDMLVLRDLGLAGRSFLPGEGPLGYQAPEQRRRTRDRPGPPTDVFQLAVVAYHLLTGQLPATNNPLPLRHYRSDLPEPVGWAVDAALSADPSKRPGLELLGAAFGPSSADPPEERSCAS